LQCVAVWCCVSQCVAVHNNIHDTPRLLLLVRLHYGVVVCCSVLHCVAVHNNIHKTPRLLLIMRLHHVVAVCCSVLQCDAVCCSMLQYVTVHNNIHGTPRFLLIVRLHYGVAVCCSVLQCIITYTKRHSFLRGSDATYDHTLAHALPLRMSILWWSDHNMIITWHGSRPMARERDVVQRRIYVYANEYEVIISS